MDIKALKELKGVPCDGIIVQDNSFPIHKYYYIRQDSLEVSLADEEDDEEEDWFAFEYIQLPLHDSTEEYTCSSDWIFLDSLTSYYFVTGSLTASPGYQSLFPSQLIDDGVLEATPGSIVTNKDSKFKKPSKKNLKKDEFGTDLVIKVIDNNTIYLSEALRLFLEINKNHVGITTTEEGQPYFYIESDEEEGYSVTAKGQVICPIEIIYLRLWFGNTEVLYVNPSKTKEDEYPAYDFYQITDCVPNNQKTSLYKSKLTTKQY